MTRGQGFRKYSRRFRLFVALSQVESVRRFARYVRSDDDLRHAAFSDPLLSSRYEFRADARASAGMPDNEATDHAVRLNLEMADDAYVDPADHGSFATGHENDTIRQKRVTSNSVFHCGEGNRVAEFATQPCYRFGIGNIDGTYVYLHSICCDFNLCPVT